MARLIGRLRHRLTPWRRRTSVRLAFPRPRTAIIWSEEWRDAGDWLRDIESACADVHHGGDYDHWDLEVRGGLLGAMRLRLAIEEHGGGRQLIRIRSWPRLAGTYLIVFAGFVLLTAAAAADDAWVASAILGAISASIAARAVAEISTATATAVGAIGRTQHRGAQ